MPNSFNPGDSAFLIESGRDIREVQVAKFAGGFYTVRFKNGNGAIKVRESRLFSSKEQAADVVTHGAPTAKAKPKYRSPWDYE